MQVIGIVGWKNSGKTGLMIDLVGELKRRSLTVATVKYAHESVVMDQPGKDSFRHFEAGADESVLVAPGRWAHFGRSEAEERAPLATHLSRLGPVDVVLVEGVKHGDHPKLEIRSGSGAEALVGAVPNVIAIVGDGADPSLEAVPCFRRSAVAAIADFALDPT